MKKIIIVNNNMKVGGVQKSLYNLLWAIDGKYDVTLLLFRAVGEYVDALPPNVKILECSSLFRYLGVSQGDCADRWADALKRGILAAVCKVFGRAGVLKLLLLSQKELPENYDCAISFLQNGNQKSFYGGAQEFVLRRVRAEKKAAFLHCDYRSSGADNAGNNQNLNEFDMVAACSDGCRDALLQVLPHLQEKCITVRNCHKHDEIRMLAEADSVQYDAEYCNVVMVSRIAHEKGIERAINAVAYCVRRGLPVMLHIVGSGAMQEQLHEMVRQMALEDRVRFCGEQGNPYRFMKNADLFLMTSYHEAAPMVIEEARCLGVPVLTAETCSSHEMVTMENGGWVCANNQDAIEQSLAQVLSNRQELQKRKAMLCDRSMDNAAAVGQFAMLIEG